MQQVTGDRVQRESKAPAFQFYAKEYLTDEAVVLMTLEEQGAYVRFLCYQWIEGSIPSDAAAQARICGVPLTRMKKLWKAIASKFVSLAHHRDRLVNRHLEEVRQNRDEWIEKSRVGGLRSAQTRAQKRDRKKGRVVQPPYQPNGNRPVEVWLQPNGNTASASASALKDKSPCVPLLKKGEDTPSGALPRRKEPLPANWAPNGAHRTLAASLSLDVAAELEQFRDHAASTGRRLVSWDAAFRMWLRRGAELHRNGKHAPTPADDGGELSPNGDFRWSDKAGRWLKR